ncbi:MAG: hypothetical protein Aurels2KO_37560 [Aureliella sp.]
MGCSGSDSAETNQSETEVSVGDQAEDSAEATAEADERTSKYVSRESLPEHWLLPIQDTDQFFTAPVPTAAPVAPTEAKVADAQVRLLGFATVGSGADAIATAILKFADKLVYLKVGDSHAGVELVSIEQKSVKLQQGRERWTLALMSQPITNAPVPYPEIRRDNSSAVSSQRRSFPPAGEPSPFPDDGFPPTTDFPAGPLPLPQESLPQIPDIELPDLDIPGFELPDFPGL